MFADHILDVKGRDVAMVASRATVADAAATLANRNIGALVVSDDGTTVIGILSERDIVRRLAAEGGGIMSLTVGDLMESAVATCGGRSTTEEMMNVMSAGHFRHIPIVDDGRLAGIISIGDVVKARIRELAHEREQLVGYIRDGR